MRIPQRLPPTVGEPQTVLWPATTDSFWHSPLRNSYHYLLLHRLWFDQWAWPYMRATLLILPPYFALIYFAAKLELTLTANLPYRFWIFCALCTLNHRLFKYIQKRNFPTRAQWSDWVMLLMNIGGAIEIATLLCAIWALWEAVDEWF